MVADLRHGRTVACVRDRLKILWYGHTERVTCVRGVENRHFCIGNYWLRRVDALHVLKQHVRLGEDHCQLISRSFDYFARHSIRSSGFSFVH